MLFFMCVWVAKMIVSRSPLLSLTLVFAARGRCLGFVSFRRNVALELSNKSSGVAHSRCASRCGRRQFTARNDGAARCGAIHLVRIFTTPI